ncbi:Phosphomannomutase/phosphoglucomutase [Candidatus Bealeia paramacronuclearis]|uniref:Phosphomannomutase/phosphoglucomutase n=1 Tax=Candidatus Bealeia paramacronuclearis TaxID=1921001 RepID=A0ABZ2CAZ8_9PROT|nr:Phosphomannomutase/phosphoglucomutase [Candidatus Bealeia paramacronuclearis]
MSHKFHPIILKEYDIRGIYQETLTHDDAYLLGQVYSQIVRNAGGKSIVTLRDGRISSPALEGALVEGLATGGLHVFRLGIGPTPLAYFGEHHLKADAAIMVTGSHNPPNHNGFKLTLKTAPFYGKDIQALTNLSPFRQSGGSYEDCDIQEAYLDRITQDLNFDPQLKIIWDAGNGASGEILEKLVKRLPCKSHTLFTEINGEFPNHHPDPSVEKNLLDLQKTVAEKSAHIGIAFDGDGDRLGAIDSQGRIIWGDQLLALFAQGTLKTHPGSTIIGDVKASQAVFDMIKSAGGVPLMWKTGHSNIKSKMKEINSPLGGEMSGHFFFRDRYYGFDDGIYAALRLIDLVSHSGTTLDTLYDQVPQMHATPEIRFECANERKFLVPEEIKARLKLSQISYSDIDGIRVQTPQGWWLLRASNTQDVLVARCESASEDGLESLQKHLTKELHLSKVIIR